MLVYTACSDGILETGPEQGTGESATDSTPLDKETDSPGEETDSIVNHDTDDTDTDSSTDCSEAGVRYVGTCWYQGERDQNCYEVCETRGGYFEATSQYIGTSDQGGTKESCDTIVGMLINIDDFKTFEVDLMMAGVGMGLGCYWHDQFNRFYYTTNPNFDASHKSLISERICGCNR